ncbi:MAG: zinc-ribbon domain-containing protein [Candidatus Thorarchaeota archaeon]|nr:zinc-ribbon domain-containing protein [Candidatus Thorarchaeota archaeon]
MDTSKTYCPNCGKSLEGSWEYCPHCGQILSPKCPRCGADIIPGMKFCPNCGAPIETSSIDIGTRSSIDSRVEKRDDMWILLVLGVIMIIAGLFFGVCFFLGIIMIVIYVIMGASKKPRKE